jgi:hypothetical protein
MRVELQVPKAPHEPGPWEDASELGPHPIASLVDAIVGDEIAIETTADPSAKLGSRVELLRQEKPTATLGPVVLIAPSASPGQATVQEPTSKSSSAHRTRGSLPSSAPTRTRSSP